MGDVRVVTRVVYVATGDEAPQSPVPPVLRAAARGRTRGRDMAVLIELCEHLSTDEWRAVRVWYVARTLGLHREAVSASLRRLATAGLVERSGPPARMEYRIAPVAADSV